MTQPNLPTAPLWLVVNAASGSNSDAAVEALTTALGAAGHAPMHTVRFPDDTLPDLATLRKSGIATLAIFTGDGTVNSQVALLHGWDGAVLVLPGGTQNLLAKALHGDISAAAIAGRLGEGTLARVARPAIATSQGQALVEVLAGPGATWADVRESVRDRDLGAIATTLGEAMRQTTGGATVHVIDPASGKPEGYRAIRIAVEADTLACDGYDAANLSDLAAQGIATLVNRDFRAGPHDHLGQASTITCRSAEPIALMIDGERYDGGTEEQFACVTLPVHFLSAVSSA